MERKYGSFTKTYEALKVHSFEFDPQGNERRCFTFIPMTEEAQLLYVPDLDAEDHYHIEFSRSELERLRDWLKAVLD